MKKIIANPSPKEVIGRASECMRRLLEAGLPYEALQMPINDREMRKRLVRFWNLGGFPATTSQKRAREIMGKNYLGAEEAIKCFGVNPWFLHEVPFSEATLEKCKNTHILVAVLPLTILGICNNVARNLFCQPEDAWYKRELFAQDHGGEGMEVNRWYLVRNTPVPNSTSKNWNEQKMLIGEDEYVPSARVMVYTIIGHYQLTGEQLFENMYLRCSDALSDDRRVYVGGLYGEGLGIGDYLEDECCGTLGISSARKPD